MFSFTALNKTRSRWKAVTALGTFIPANDDFLLKAWSPTMRDRTGRSVHIPPRILYPSSSTSADPPHCETWLKLVKAEEDNVEHNTYGLENHLVYLHLIPMMIIKWFHGPGTKVELLGLFRVNKGSSSPLVRSEDGGKAREVEPGMEGQTGKKKTNLGL